MVLAGSLEAQSPEGAIGGSVGGKVRAHQIISHELKRATRCHLGVKLADGASREVARIRKFFFTPLALLGGRRPDTLDFTQPIFTLLQSICGLEVTKTLAHLRAVPGPPVVRRQLELRADQALMQLDETCYTRLCQPVLCCRTLYTDFFDFSIVRKLL